MNALSTIALVGGLLLTAASAQSQQIWRCGADGRSFSDQPCANGAALESVRPRPADDVMAAAERQTRDTALAQSLRLERLRRESRAAGSGSRQAAQSGKAPHISQRGAARDEPAARQKPLKRPAADGTFRATVPASPRSSG